METKKENKKGFWASLFSPKPCSCSCGDNLIIEETKKPATPCCENKEATTHVGIKEVKVLGPGCTKCKTTYQAIEKVINDYHLDVALTKVDDIAEIMNYNIMGTPAIVVDGVVKVKGHVPTENEIKQLFGI